ncbi:MAG: hypothetical protein AUJ75_01235 [Candidatus Omnitrophica bacterium CG1_02_49_10]|nr:MAG: hypothetical protein AUJ75_01235 [Candidatus Omnitrophica bacterium CG1_02_49_10]
MRSVYFDCYSGVSGDMIVASLLDAGLDMDILKGELEKLSIDGYGISSHKVKRGAISGTRFEVSIDEGAGRAHSRSVGQIVDIIKKSALSEKVKAESISVFDKLARAEGKIHGIKPEDVRLHEVGSLDSIVDVVASMAALEALGIESVYASILRVGRGFAETEHGRIPVPAPATLEILRGIPVDFTDIETEITTPTGSAIIFARSSSFGPLNGFKVERIGYGAGSKEIPSIPNMLRAVIISR